MRELPAFLLEYDATVQHDFIAPAFETAEATETLRNLTAQWGVQDSEEVIIELKREITWAAISAADVAAFAFRILRAERRLL